MTTSLDQAKMALWDDNPSLTDLLGFDAVVAAVESALAAFASKKTHRTDRQLIVRRVERLNARAAAQGQGELFATYHYHAMFTDSPFPLAQNESQHRGHAIVEQILADLINGRWPTSHPANSTPTPPGYNSQSPRTP